MYMTVSQAARAAGITRSAVYQAIERGKLPALNLKPEEDRAFYLIDPADVRARWGNRPAAA